MCVIFVADCRTQLQDLNLPSAWKTNAHGAGIIALNGKRNPLIIRKGIMSLYALERVLDALPKKLPVALHLRLATHGSACKANTHPFKVDSKQYLMHNGILDGLGSYGDKGQSDTAHLAKILSKLSYKDRKALLDALTGKFVLASPQKFKLYGYFTEEKGVAMSNTYWKPGIYNYVSDGKGNWSRRGDDAGEYNGNFNTSLPLRIVATQQPIAITEENTSFKATLSEKVAEAIFDSKKLPVDPDFVLNKETGMWKLKDTPTTNDADEPTEEDVNQIALENLDSCYGGYN